MHDTVERGAWSSIDSGLYVSRVDSASVDGKPLRFEPGVNVATGLSATARLAVWQTIVGLHDSNHEFGLSGEVIVDGTEHSLDDENLAQLIQVSSEASNPHPAATPKPLAPNVTDALEAALAVSDAELRGARATIEDSEPPVESVAAPISEADSAQVATTLAGVEELLLDDLARRAIEVLVRTPDTPDVRTRLTQVLVDLNIEVDDAPHEVAERVLAEQAELSAIQKRLSDTLATKSIETWSSAASRGLSQGHVEEFLAQLERKVSTQTLLLDMAKGTLVEAPRPLVLFEPISGLTDVSAQAVLDLIDDVSDGRQIIIVSDDERLLTGHPQASWHRLEPSGWFCTA